MAWGLLHAAAPPLSLPTTAAADIHAYSTYEACTLLIADLKVWEFVVFFCFFILPAGFRQMAASFSKK